MSRHVLHFLFPLLFLNACIDDPVPKPMAMLRLTYPEAQYTIFKDATHYQFKKNTTAIITPSKKETLLITYPTMKATLFLTYNPIKNNINRLCSDAQKRTYTHMIKADEIIEQPYINPHHRTYGMLYEITGNAASQLQFYLTDSTKHFISGALYFYTRPNYDSILPAIAYLKKDLKNIVETLRWKTSY